MPAYLLIGLSLITLFTLGFAKMADNLLDYDGLVHMDLPIYDYLRTLRTPFLTKFFTFITTAGNWQIILFLTLLFGVFLILRHKWALLLSLSLTDITALSFIGIAKNIAGRARPPIENALVTERSYSFPSGHSYFAVAFYGFLVYLLIRHTKNRLLKAVYSFGGLIFILLLSFSRLYLGVHWLTDVIAGLMASATWLTGVILVLEYEAKLPASSGRKARH